MNESVSSGKDISPTSQSETTNIDLQEIISVLWASRIFITAMFALSGVFAILYALSLPNVYKAEAILVPSEAEYSGSSIAQAASQFSGLASIAGLSLPQIGGSSAKVAIEIMRSRKFFEEYLYENILPDLMAASEWNKITDKVLYDQEIYDASKKEWIEGKPSIQKSHLVFRSLIEIKPSDINEFVTIYATHVSPTVAKSWVDIMVSGINERLRKQDVDKSKKAIEFLTQQSELTSLVSLKMLFSSLIEEQTQKYMLASITEEYGFETIDPAVAPEEKSGPPRAAIVVVSVFIVTLLSVIFAFALHYKEPVFALFRSSK